MNHFEIGDRVIVVSPRDNKMLEFRTVQLLSVEIGSIGTVTNAKQGMFGPRVTVSFDNYPNIKYDILEEVLAKYE